MTPRRSRRRPLQHPHRQPAIHRTIPSPSLCQRRRIQQPFLTMDRTTASSVPRMTPKTPPPPQTGRPRRIAYDDRVRIRDEYDAIKERNGGRAPRGTLESLASRFNCTKNQAHDICYRKGD